MAIAMELEESVSDSKLHKDSTGKKDLRPASAVSFSKSDIGPEKTPSNESLKQYKHWVTNERWIELKKIADVAMKQHKVFTIKGGGYPAVRRALHVRGWVEKPESHRVKNNLNDLQKVSHKKDPLTRVDKMILYKFLQHYSIDFLWTSKRDKYDWLLSNKDVIISRFCRSIFTSKEGLCASLTQMHWYTEPGVSLTKFPRCYNIHNSEHMDEFIDDFRITACIGILKWLSDTLRGSRESDMVCLTGKVPYTAIEFAMNRLIEYIDFHTHCDIDMAEDHRHHIWEHEWDQFLTHHYLLVHEGAKFIEDSCLNLRPLEKKSSKVLAEMVKHWPQIEIDGVLNIWIVKPGNKCRGKGIHLMNNIKDIVGLMNVTTTPKTRYVVQKYIENPLVIYNTKFDIRQWFLITSTQPLTIWIYRDSYLRFSSQIFSLSNYHESVHLTNNAVQSKYKNHGTRDKALPEENMWDCHSFKAYLRQIGQADMWDSKIFPGMKQCLIGAMLACQESMDKRPNSFELYGADFMLSADFTPWLIEINSSPDLGHTTSVTARLCPQCLEDVIKVVVDRRNNPESDTGTFELAYRQFIPKAPAYLGLSLCLNGRKVFKKHKTERKIESAHNSALSRPTPKTSSNNNNSSKIIDQKVPLAYSGPIITDFLNWLNPYEAFPTDKNGVLLPIDRSSTPRKPFTAIKSGLLHSKKTKHKSTPSSQGKGDKKDGKRSPASTVNPKESPKNANFSVGNKRCYIDPQNCEREAANVLHGTLAVQNHTATKQQPSLKLQTKSGLVVVAPELKPDCVKIGTTLDSTKKIAAVGRNIAKLRNERVSLKENYNHKMNSIYGPYRMAVSPISDDIIFK